MAGNGICHVLAKVFAFMLLDFQSTWKAECAMKSFDALHFLRCHRFQSIDFGYLRYLNLHKLQKAIKQTLIKSF